MKRYQPVIERINGAEERTHKLCQLLSAFVKAQADELKATTDLCLHVFRANKLHVVTGCFLIRCYDTHFTITACFTKSINRNVFDKQYL